MNNLNRVMLVGQLTADSETSTLESGQQKTTFRVATNYSWKDKSGEWKEGADFHQVVAWRKIAETAAKFKKGERVLVEGKLHSYNWEAKDGTKRYATEVVVSAVSLMAKANPKEVKEKEED